MNRLFILCLTILSLLKINAFGQSTVTGGDVSGTWKLADSPFLIEDNITIPNDSTLIIEPGVTIEFQGHYFLNVQGRLLAEGTEADSILFTVNDTTGFSLPDTTLGGWYGIRFIDTPINNDSSKIVFCRLEYGKAVAPVWHLYAGGAICILQFGKVLISNCLIQNNFSAGTAEENAIAGGLYFFKSDIVVKNTAFKNNRSYGGGAIYFDESNPVFENNTFENNSAVDGGAIAMGGESYPSFENDKFLNNIAKNQGGGIAFWESAVVKCVNVTFSGNSARFGGGIGVWDTELQVDNCLFSDNHADEWGGGVAGDMATMKLTNCTFSRDTSDWGSGGLHIYNSEATVSNCTFNDNKAEFGGGLYLSISEVNLEDNNFIDNQANSGGAVKIENADPLFKNNTFKNNYATDAGGAIAMQGENHPTFTGDTFTDNEAVHHGGGIICGEPSVVKCINVEVAGNKAEWGAGIGVWGAELQADSCLFSDNHASIWGGGLASDFGTIMLNECTFTKDTSDWGSGGLHLDHAIADITNCTFEENKAVFGGGLHAVFSQITCNQNDFITNTSDGAGGIHVQNSDCIINDCLFLGNKAVNGATGAIDYSADSTIFGRSYQFNLSKSEIRQNTATAQFGGARIEQSNASFSLVDVIVDSCLFTENHSDVYGTLRLGGYMEDFVVSNSVFSLNKTDRYASGPGFISNAKGKVYNCIFNSNYSQFTDSTKTYQGASMGTEAEVEFFNCTFIDTSAAQGMGLSLRRGSIANVTNSIFWNCGNRPINIVTAAELGCTVNVNYCDIENGIDSIYVSDSLSVLNWGDGNIAEDPMFVDMVNSDLHLQDSSPCIGAGINSFIFNEEWVTAPTRDIEGNPRPSPLDSEVDMGAYEHELGIPVSSRIIEEEKTTLYQNYPNPARNSTTFRYRLSSPCYVELNIYNVFGQKIKCLVAEKQSAGTYSLEYNLNQYKSGQYFFQLQTNNGFVQTRKLVLLK